MPRPLTGELGLAVGSDRSEFVHLVEFVFSTGTILMTTGAVDLTTDPYATGITTALRWTNGLAAIQGPWPTTELTVEGWARLDVTVSATNRYIFHYGASGQDLEILLGVNGIASGGAEWRITGWVGGNSTASGTVPNDLAWHHYAMTYRSSDGQTKMYLDGVLANTTTLSSGDILGTSGFMTIGAYQQPQGTFAGTWAGSIDETRVYRRVLSAVEIAEHFNRRFVNEQKLVSVWKFDKLVQQELINAGFESGSQDWELVTGITIVSDGNARTGSWAMKYATDGVGGPNAQNNHRMRVNPGDRVFLEAWMKGVGSAGTMSIAVRWFDGTGAAIGVRETVGNTLTGPQASYALIRGISGPAPAGAVYVRYDVGENSSNTTANPWYIDDCIMSINAGDDSGPNGNYLTPTGLMTSDSDTILRRDWQAVGGELRFGGVEESSDARSQGIDVRLSGVTQTVIAALMGGVTYRGQRARIWRAHLDSESGTVVDQPLLLLEGLQLSPYEIQEDRSSRAGATVTVSTRIKGRMGIERLRGIWSNLISHQHHFPGDTFFRHIVQLANSKAFWGVPFPTGISGGPGSGIGGIPDDAGGGDSGGDQPQDAI